MELTKVGLPRAETYVGSYYKCNKLKSSEIKIGHGLLMKKFAFENWKNCPKFQNFHPRKIPGKCACSTPFKPPKQALVH